MPSRYHRAIAPPNSALPPRPDRDGDDAPHGLALHLPSLGSSLRHALPTLVDGVAGPAAVFYLALVLAGERPAIVAALCWSAAAFARRLVRRRRVPAVVVVGAVLLALRSALAYLTGSAIVYFAQPAAGTVLLGVAFLVSARRGRPLTERFAHDFCPLDHRLLQRPFVRRFFSHIALLWGAILLVNAGVGLWLLFGASLQSFLVLRTLVTWGLDLGGVAVSTLWFTRLLRRHGIQVLWRGRPGALAQLLPREPASG